MRTAISRRASTCVLQALLDRLRERLCFRLIAHRFVLEALRAFAPSLQELSEGREQQAVQQQEEHKETDELDDEREVGRKCQHGSTSFPLVLHGRSSVCAERIASSFPCTRDAEGEAPLADKRRRNANARPSRHRNAGRYHRP